MKKTIVVSPFDNITVMGPDGARTFLIVVKLKKGGLRWGAVVDREKLVELRDALTEVLDSSDESRYHNLVALLEG